MLNLYQIDTQTGSVKLLTTAKEINTMKRSAIYDDVLIWVLATNVEKALELAQQYSEGTKKSFTTAHKGIILKVVA